MKKYIITLFVLINIHFVYSQNEMSGFDSVYHYRVGDKIFYYSRVSVVNKTDGNILLWFHNPNISVKRNPFYDYFFKKNGDFTLYNVITEYQGTLVINDLNEFPVIFKTFYKVIHPNSSFDIYMIDPKKSGGCVNRPNMIQTITEAELENMSISISDKFEELSYKPDYIVLMDSLF